MYVAKREETRGRVLVYLHGAHLRRTKTRLPWYEFWPTGAHLEQVFGANFAVIGGSPGDVRSQLHRRAGGGLPRGAVKSLLKASSQRSRYG